MPALDQLMEESTAEERRKLESEYDTAVKAAHRSGEEVPNPEDWAERKLKAKHAPLPPFESAPLSREREEYVRKAFRCLMVLEGHGGTMEYARYLAEHGTWEFKSE